MNQTKRFHPTRAQTFPLRRLIAPAAFPACAAGTGGWALDVKIKHERIRVLEKKLEILEKYFDKIAAAKQSRVTPEQVEVAITRRRSQHPAIEYRGWSECIQIVVTTPNRLLERGIAAPGLLAQIIVSKYCDHLPLYRQEQIYASPRRVQLPRKQ